MNFKTTVSLVFVLLALLVGVLWWKPSLSTPTDASGPSDSSSVAEKPLFDSPPEKVVKVACTLGAQQSYRFERGNPDVEDETKAEWRMVEPFEAGVPRYEVDSVVNRLKNLKYQIKYGAGAEGITPALAGLEPARYEVTLEQKDGKTHRIQVGKAASSSETYIRLATGPDIYVVQTTLDNLVKKRPEEYRDKSLLSFNAPDVVSVTLTHRPEEGGEVRYELAKRDSGGWFFEQPFTAAAETKPVDDAVRAIAKLRVTDWVEAGAASRLGPLGLAPPRLEMEVVCREKVPPASSATGENADENAAEATPKEEFQEKRYSLNVAARGPLDKEGFVYAKSPNETAVGTISKSVADKLVPVVEQWRNMRLCPTSVADASKIEIRTNDGQSGVFVRQDAEHWVYEESQAPAESTAIKELLDKIDTLHALAFVDHADPKDPEFGLNPPLAQITITVPGREEPERLFVGKPTDEASKRLYFVRRGESTSVAKIRAPDVVPLKRTPLDYQDRQILSLNEGNLARIEIDRPNRFTSARETIVLEKNESGIWRVVEPSAMDSDPAAVAPLMASVTNLRAEAVVTPSADASRFGLAEPRIRARFVSRVLPQSADAPAEDRTVELLVGAASNKYYAKLGDSDTLFKLNSPDYETLGADFGAKTVFSFEVGEVVSVSVSSAGATHQFDKSNGAWKYAAEPDLPIDPTKVNNLVLQLQEMRGKGNAAYDVEDLAVYGLDQPARVVKITLADGKSVQLSISEQACPSDPDKGFYAILEGGRNVFLIAPAVASRASVSLDDFEKAAS